MSNRPLLLDLYCGAGGAAVGYYRAGFDILGVDISPQPRFPYRFMQADALEVLEWLLAHPTSVLGPIAAIHASPPCQRYSVMSNCQPGLAEQYPDVVAQTRELLLEVGLPYVIENVPKAPLRDPITLCASQFGARTYWPVNGWVGLRRHRCFEANWPLWDLNLPCDHSLRVVPVCGHGSGACCRLKGKGCAQAGREVMGIDWMNREELAEAVPPYYTEYIGGQLIDYLLTKAA